jgi:hypothetical protein
MRAWYNRAVSFAISVLAAAVVVAAGTGCSGDKSGGKAAGTTAATTTAAATTSTATTTQEQPTTTFGARPTPGPNQSRWAAQTDDACKPWQQKIAQYPTPVDAASLESYFASVLPLVRKQIAAVKAVKPPAKADEVRRAQLFIASLQRVERALTSYLRAIRANNGAAIQAALVAANAAGAATREYAASLDITQCGGYSSG